MAEPGRFVGLANFRNLWDNQIYRQTLRNTIVFTVGATILKLARASASRCCSTSSSR